MHTPCQKKARKPQETFSKIKLEIRLQSHKKTNEYLPLAQVKKKQKTAKGRPPKGGRAKAPKARKRATPTGLAEQWAKKEKRPPLRPKPTFIIREAGGLPYLSLQRQVPQRSKSAQRSQRKKKRARTVRRLCKLREGNPPAPAKKRD